MSFGIGQINSSPGMAILGNREQLPPPNAPLGISTESSIVTSPTNVAEELPFAHLFAALQSSGSNTAPSISVDKAEKRIREDSLDAYEGIPLVDVIARIKESAGGQLNALLNQRFIQLFDHLSAENVDINAPFHMHFWGDYFTTPLHTVLDEYGGLENVRPKDKIALIVMKALLEAGANPNIIQYDATPLHRLCTRFAEEPKIIPKLQWLIDHKADLNVFCEVGDDYGFVLMRMASRGHIEIVQFLCSQKTINVEVEEASSRFRDIPRRVKPLDVTYWDEPKAKALLRAGASITPYILDELPLINELAEQHCVQKTLIEGSVLRVLPQNVVARMVFEYVEPQKIESSRKKTRPPTNSSSNHSAQV